MRLTSSLKILTDKQLEQIEKLRGLPVVHHHGDWIIIRDRQHIEPSQVTVEVAAHVHTTSYIDKFFNGKTDANEQRATGFVWSEGLASRVRYETGGTLLAARLSLERGLACSTAGGTHHAFPDKGAGYCLINDLAVTAQYLIDTGMVNKVLIVDLDVHQGDGTSFIFKDSENVFTFDMHCGKNFPFRKQKSDLDIPLNENLEDIDYLNILQGHLPDVLDSFRPGLVLFDAGVDPHKDDELGKLRLTDEGLFKRDEYVLEQVVKRGIPVATVIGGGYSRDIDKLGLRHTIVHRAASKVWRILGL